MICIAVSSSLYINLHHYGIICLSSYFFIISKIFLIGTLILFFIKETHEQDSNADSDLDVESHSILLTLKRIRVMASNTNLRKFIGVLLLANIGNIFFHNVLTLVLIEKGITQELLTNISTLLIPLEIYFSFYLSSAKTDFLKTYMHGYKNLIYIFIIQFTFVIFYEYLVIIDKSLYNIPIVVFIFTVSLVRTLLCLKCFSGIGGFFHKISDNRIGATYITALNSFNNLSFKWPGFFIFTFVDYFGYKIVGLISLIYCGMFFYLFEEQYKKFDEIDAKEWKIELDCKPVKDE